MKKKFLSLLTVLALMLSMVPAALAAEESATPLVVETAEAAQAALDAAGPNTTIQLKAGVDYGTLLIRPVEGKENTTTGSDYNVYREEYLRKVENLTIIGASGAKVDAIKVVAGYIEGSTCYFADIKNLVVDSVEFTDEHTNAPHSYAAPLFFDLSYINIDGLAVKDCELIGNNDKMNLVYLYAKQANNSTFSTAAKNITITGNTVDGIARLCELREAENVTIADNTIENTAQHGMLLAVNSGKTYSGSVTITGNIADSIGERFVRMAGAGASTVVITGNTVTNYLGSDADYIKVTDSTGTPTIENNTLVYAAQIDETKYATLAAAIAEAESGDTVTLLDDVTLTETLTIPAGKTVTLDLNGKTVSYTTTENKGDALITNAGDLTIKDSATNGKITYAYTGAADSSYGYGNYTIANTGKLTVNSGTIENTTEKKSHAYYTIQNGQTGETIINGGKIVNNTSYAIRLFNGSASGKSAVTVNGGEVEGTRAFWIQAAGSDNTVAPNIELNINGGIVTGTGETGYTLASYVYGYGNLYTGININIAGGTITGDIALGGGGLQTDNGRDKTGLGAETLNISGGTFNGDIYTYNSTTEDKITITGGVFESDITAYVPEEGYTWFGDAEADPYTWYVGPSYTISIDPNGGSFAEGEGYSITTMYGGTLDLTYVNENMMPTRSGYTFKGWYTAATGGTLVTTDTVFSENSTIYAQWTQNSTPITPSAPVTPSTPAEPEVEVPSVDTSAPTVSTETKENEDGSTTKTETKEDGVVVETTTNTDGSKTESATKTETVETEEGKTTTTTTSTTTTDASGNTSTESKEEVKVETASGTTTTTTTVTESATKTETKEEVTETVKNEDGTETTTTTSTTETALTNGSTGTTTVASDGTTTAEVTVSSTAVAEAAAAGAAVELAMPAVTASTESEAAAQVTVTLPAGTASATVEIPVDNTSSGVVAVIVNADGTEEVIKTTIETENGIAVEVPDGATIKVVDNSKDFADVSSAAKLADDINFVASRELFTGTTTETFSPDADATRGQMMTVLARYDGVEASGRGAIEKGMDWAVEAGISDGTNASQAITRQQLVTMLWRLAGEPASTGSIDEDGVADYAKTAMAWAVENGILTGFSDGTYRPEDTATRAQLAAFVARYVKLSA